MSFMCEIVSEKNEAVSYTREKFDFIGVIDLVRFEDGRLGLTARNAEEDRLLKAFLGQFKGSINV
jgi:hypothetical protein